MSKHKPQREPSPLAWESGLEIKPVYTAEDVEASGGWDRIG